MKSSHKITKIKHNFYFILFFFMINILCISCDNICIYLFFPLPPPARLLVLRSLLLNLLSALHDGGGASDPGSGMKRRTS